MIIGYPVSGHPLDGIEEFVRAKSKNLGVVLELVKKEEQEELPVIVPGVARDIVNEDVTDEVPLESRQEDSASDGDIPQSLPIPENETLEENIYAQLIGAVSEVRKIQTKSGGMMMVATVESVGFDFRIVIFPRDYEKYESKIEEDMMVVANGRVKWDSEK